jgi:uncharacterized protein YacL
MKTKQVFIVVAILIGCVAGYQFAPTKLFELFDAQLLFGVRVGGAVLGATLGWLGMWWWLTKVLPAWQKASAALSSKQLLLGTIGALLGLWGGSLFGQVLQFLPRPFSTFLPVLSSASAAWLGWVLFVEKTIALNWAQALPTSLAALANSENSGVSRTDALNETVQARRTPETSPYETNQVLLDTSVIIDGRIVDICKTGFIRSKVLVPRFVLQELQYIADSQEAMRRQRGRRGLEALNRLQKDTEIPVQIVDLDVPNVREVDSKLIALGKQLRCPVITNDYNLNRVAEIQGVTILNINELANAVKSVVLPGESLNLQIIQEGKEHSQGIGYLDDGTMVVVEDGMRFINAFVDVTVTKILQTNAGRMVFARKER